MNAEEKFELITNNLQEIVGEDELKEILKERDLKVYWGTAPTGKPHIGYFLPIRKIGDLLKAGCHVKILFADLHAFLDNQKAPWDLLEYRTKYYEFIIKEMLKSIEVPIDKLEFIRGTEFQLNEKYTLDMYKIASLASIRDVRKAGAEVVKQLENPKMSPLIYPILQALDEEYLNVDAQFGGVDQRKIFMFAREFMPLIGYKKRIHLMNQMIPGLTGDKMSSSDKNSKIDILDDEKTIQKKLNKAYCEIGNIENNGILPFAEMVIFPILKNKNKTFTINRPEKFGGDLNFNEYKDLETCFKNKELHPMDLKQGISKMINELVVPIRNAFNEDKNIQEITKKAYPEEY